MRASCIAGVVCWFALTSAVIGQQKIDSQTSRTLPQATTNVHSFVAGDVAGFKLVLTRTQSGDRETVTEVTETPGTNGRFETSTKTTSETVGIGSDHVKTVRDVFANDAEGRLKLIERTDADQQTFQDGTSRTVENTSVPDANGHLGLSYRRVQETSTTAPNVGQTQITFYLPGINKNLIEAERVQQTERQLGPNLIQTDSQRDVPDADGRWQTTEASQEVRTIGPAEVVEEKTVRRLDANGRLTLGERTITRRSASNGSDQAVTEVYSADIPGVARDPDSPLELDHRVRVTTSATVGTGSQTISETEARRTGVANGPFQIVARTVEIAQQIGPDRWETQRQIFGLDGSGRLVLIFDEKGETEGKLPSTQRSFSSIPPDSRTLASSGATNRTSAFSW
jgi:hypothetical protein